MWGRCRGDVGEMWGRCGEIGGDVGRCREMWGDVGEIQGDMRMTLATSRMSLSPSASES